MKIAVVGAGIIGVTTAYELATDGHEVTVFERHGATAEESSFANGGLVTPGHIAPWAAPGAPSKLLRGLFGAHGCGRLGLRLSGAEMAWMWRWYRSCQAETHLVNRARLHRLAAYSQQRLQALTTLLQLSYERSDGQLVLLRTDRDIEMIQAGLKVLRDAEFPFTQMNAAQARTVEPALNPDTAFSAALHLPGDEVGNCRQFALLLKNEALRNGAAFLFSHSIANIKPGKQVELSVTGEAAPRVFDAVVMCAGLGSAALLKPIGLKIPLAGVSGYSLSTTVRESLNAPRSAVIDERFQVKISRLGARIRVSGGAELGDYAHTKHAGTVQSLYKVLHDWFPGAANLGNGVQVWKGVQAMLPDGPPLIGASSIPGVWLNLGHGAAGWTTACGSARALADLLAQKVPEVSLDGFGVERIGIRQ